MNFFEKLQQLDRRWIYLILAVAIILPLIFPFNSKTYTTRTTEDLYQMIDSFSHYTRNKNNGVEAIDTDRAILLSFSHDASTMPELYPMELAILRHCFERKVKVFAFTFYATAAPIIDMAINEVKKSYPEVRSGYEYVNFGYKVPALFLPIILGMGEDIAEAMDIDAEGRKISGLPIMSNVKNYNEMNLVIEFSGSAAGGSWITYARPRFGVNVAVGVTAVMAADYYPQLQTGQLIGMLAGLKGAAEYEKLVDVFATNPDPANREFSKNNLRSESFVEPIITEGKFGGLGINTEIKDNAITVVSTQRGSSAHRSDLQPGDKIVQVNGVKVSDMKEAVDIINASLLKKVTIGIQRAGNFDILEIEIEKGIPYAFRQARIGMNAQSVAHILIIVFILVGNIGYFVQKYMQKKEAK
jgi:hypothetical protein